MTIHITPEPEFSYVSFESNIPLTSYLGVIQRVLDTFMPGKFILTIFANRVSLPSKKGQLQKKSRNYWTKKIFKFSIFQTSMAAESHKELQKTGSFGDWARKDIQYSQFQNYELTYAHFVRYPS